MSNSNDFVINNGILEKYIGRNRDVIIPDSVTRIRWWAFGGCTSLTSITLPDSVTSIGTLPFCACSKLTIYAPVGSYAEAYAKENNIPFVAE